MSASRRCRRSWRNLESQRRQYDLAGAAQSAGFITVRVASVELRLQAMGVTEPTTGTDITKIRTTAVRNGDRYVVNGQKV